MDLQPPTSSKQSQRPEDHAPAAAAFPCTPKAALLAMASFDHLPLRSGSTALVD
jgi:hypothetical protein